MTQCRRSHVLLRLCPDGERVRAGIVVRVIERLHRDLEHDLVAVVAGTPTPFEIAAVGREGQRDRSGQLGDRLRGALC